MTENEPTTRPEKKAAKLVALIILGILCILLLIVVALRIYLATSLPAPQLSRELTSYLHQPFTVQRIETSGNAIILKGLRLQNPPGFPKENLAAADSVTIAPEWGGLLSGRQRFRLIAVSGVSINLDQNSSGVWNYSEIQKILTRKPSKKETLIEDLVIRNGSLRVQGYGVQGVSLQVFNLTTKGSLESKLDLAFEDAAHNRYLVKGKARPGADSALDLALTAPSLSLKDAAHLLKVKNPDLFSGGKGSLQLNASLHKGIVSTDGGFYFTGLRLPGQAGFPVTGRLDFVGDYDIRNDSGTLKNGTLSVVRLGKIHAEGKASGLRTDRQFSLQLAMDEADLSMLNLLLSDEARKKLSFAGRMRCDSLRLEGNRQGLKIATGTLKLHDGALVRGGRLLVSGLGGTIGFSRRPQAIEASGKLSVSGRHENAVVQTLNMPASLTLSPKLKPLKAELPALSATIMGTPFSGRIAFDAAKASPVTASLKLPRAILSTFNDQLKRAGVHADAGTASVVLDVAGKSTRDFGATAKVRLANFRGSRGKTVVAVRDGSTSAVIQKKGGRLSLRGDAHFSALDVNGKTGSAEFAYRLADNILDIEGAHASAGGVELSISHLSTPIPVKRGDANVTTYPLSVDMEGAQVKERDVAVSDLSGRLRGTFNTHSAGSWLDGTADLTSRSVAYRGKKVAAPVVHGTFSKGGGKADATGELFSGKLAGTVNFNPFALDAGQSFELAVTGADLAAISEFLPKGASYHPAGGSVDLSVKGSYSSRDGLSCRFKSKGTGIGITDASGKSMISGAGASVTGSFAKGDLAISEGVISAGEEVSLKFKGGVAQVQSPKRRGRIDFSLPQTPLNSMVDPFVNMLPRFIQEATVEGAVAVVGRVELAEGHRLVEGGLTFKDATLEVPSQKVTVDRVQGRLPFSIDLSGKGEVKPPDRVSFSRENFPRLLEQLTRPAGGEVITIAKLSLGGLQMGKVTLAATAANGVTDISSFRASLFEGEVLGKAHVNMQEKLSYRGDLMVHNSSLKALCSMFPNITGYISGRVDGVLSFSGQGTGLAAITGFTQIWAREGAGEKMVVSKEFLQRLAKQKLSGFFFRSDRPYDKAEIKAMLEEGDLTFDTLTIQHTNLIGVRDLNVNIAPGQNRIALDHLLESIKEAAVRGTPSTGAKPAETPEKQEAPATQEFKWGE